MVAIPVTSTQEMDQGQIVHEMERFFQDRPFGSFQSLPSAVEVINRDLLYLPLFLSWLFYLCLVTVYQPMMEMKRVGVQKLLGFQRRRFLAGFVKTNFYLLLGGSLVIDLGLF